MTEITSSNVSLWVDWARRSFLAGRKTDLKKLFNLNGNGNGHAPAATTLIEHGPPKGILMGDNILLVPWHPQIITATERILSAPYEHRQASLDLRMASGPGWTVNDLPVEDLVRIQLHRGSLLVPRR